MRNEIMFLIGLATGLLFLTGISINFGFGEAEPAAIPVPQNTIAGWFCIAFGIFWLCPPWVISRISKLIKRLIKGREIDRKRMQKRLEEAEKPEVT